MGLAQGYPNEETPLLPYSEKNRQKESDAVNRKMLLAITPMAFAISLSCTVSRANVGLAAMDMSKDIGLSKSQIGMVSSLFFVTYMIFQVPSNMILTKVGGPIWIGVMVIGWGLTSALTAFARNVAHLYTLRLLLGVFQAAGMPGIQYYLSLFFPDSRLSMAFGLSLAGCTVGMGLSSPVGAALLAMEGVWNLHGWQWLFLLEGLPSVLLGAAMILFFPSSPRCKPLLCGRFLTEREAQILEEDMAEKPEKANGKVEKSGYSRQEEMQYLFKTIVLNGQLWMMLCSGFLFGMARYIAMFWTPLWIGSMLDGGALEWGDHSSETTTSVEAALYATIPYGAAAAAGCVIGWSSTKLNDRIWHCFISLVVAGVVFACLPWMLEAHTVLGFVSLTFEHVGVNGCIGVFLSMAAGLMTKRNRAFGMAWINSIGNLNGVVGPMFIGMLADLTKSYSAGILVVGGMTAFAGFLVLFLKDPAKESKSSLEASKGVFDAEAQREGDDAEFGK